MPSNVTSVHRDVELAQRVGATEVGRVDDFEARQDRAIYFDFPRGRFGFAITDCAQKFSTTKLPSTFGFLPLAEPVFTFAFAFACGLGSGFVSPVASAITRARAKWPRLPASLG